MRLLYFAWVREKIGMSREDANVPDGVSNVGDLIDWLSGRGREYEEAFANKASVRVAVNQEYAKMDTPVKLNDEVAFFPPVTGG
ncbi:MAG: molybdopterin converting factor subunit 1 [Rhodospirillaceae bacterium TMED8]|nr:molybdopterin converting factor subunit 1 [Magnetovibrio sp.]OUT47728.1 MAG: molybdopterin converting factor subunit 1 [Rhodospirillaceae bacterium TMED8]|tara:strand:- start:316 stop:567 length:252 start_codon:yes stop_codon:yes gene_type:complete